MTIQASQLALYKANRNNDQNTNGGYQSLTKLANGVRNGLFSDLQSGPGLPGATEIRKVFIKQDLTNQSNSAFGDCLVFLKDIGDPGIFIDLALGTATDTQANADFNSIITGRVTKVESTQITIKTKTTKGGSIDLIRYRKSNDSNLKVMGATANPQMNNETIISGVTGSDFQVGDIVTEIVLAESTDPNSPLNLKPRVFGQAITSGGTLDDAAIRLTPRAAISLTVNITFVNQTSYSYSIPEMGISGSGATDATCTAYHPNNVGFTPTDILFEIPASAWGGVWSSASRVTFKIESGAIPLWIRRTIDVNPTMTGQQALDFSLEYLTS
ncbi:hypothetical protein [Vibrio phage vB_ValS_PJ32]|nr:hypothetical protein [Vibrio phage vB_ValS_PJ32]